jgi:transcriptional regulator with XRE-family HTH domain
VTFGDRLRALRRAHGWTQVELAQQLQVSRTTIAGYESQGKVPRDDLLVAVARLFGVSVDYLLLGEDKVPRNAEPPTPSDTGPTGLPEATDWKTLAQTLAEALKLQAENERRRIEQVDAVAQANLARLLDHLDRLTAAPEESSVAPEPTSAPRFQHRA